MTAGGLPAGYATISRLAEQPWTAGVTTTDVVAWNRNGIEWHSHGIDHKDPTPQGDAGIVDQIVNSKAEIEAWGVKCQGWMMPGATPLTSEIPYGTNLASTDDFYTTRTGRLLRQTYALTYADTMGSQRSIPFGMYHELAHVTGSDGMSLANAVLWVDTAVNYKVGVQLMIHAGNLGGSGMSVADFTALLHYIVAKRDAGNIEVLTPSGFAFADKSNQRLDLLRDGSFEGMTTGVIGAWNAAWTAGKSIETSGGRTGKFLRLSNTETSLVTQRPSGLNVMGLGGETFVFEGWARFNGAGTTTSRVLLADYTNAANLSLDLRLEGIPTTWTKVIHAFSLAPGTSVLSVSVGG